MKRDEFSGPIKKALKERAAFICSNPNCKVMTIAPSEKDNEKVQYIGKAAHITAAAAGGPRYDKNLSPEDRMSIDNAIFLCSSCADMIDKNQGIDHLSLKLREWKESHEQWVRDNLNKRIDVHSNEQKEHDKLIFLKADAIFDENVLEKILVSLDSEEIWSMDRDKLETLISFYTKVSSEYLHNGIEIARKEMLQAAKNLLEFTMNEFKVWPPNSSHGRSNFRFCMHPELNPDRGGSYEEEDVQANREWCLRLEVITTEFKNSFYKLRRLVASNLQI